MAQQDIHEQDETYRLCALVTLPLMKQCDILCVGLRQLQACRGFLVRLMRMERERSEMIANLNKDLDVTLTLCHSVSQCVCVCARALGGDVLPPSCCYVMTGVLAPSPLSTGGVICTVQPSANFWLPSDC